MTPILRSSKLNGKTTTIKTKKVNTGTPTITPVTTPITAKNKRTISTLSPDSIDTNTNTKRGKTMSAMDLQEVISLFKESTERIESKIDSTNSLFELKFNNLAKEVKDDVSSLHSTVADYHEKINTELIDVKKQLLVCSERIDNTDDDFQRMQRNQDLRLSGFAAKENENLHGIFTSIAAAIGYTIGPNTVMPSIERISMFDKTAQKYKPSQTILLHFAILRQKQQFYSLYLSKMPLDPTNFGLEKKNRIVIGEHLTAKNALVFKHALAMKKDNKIAQAFTENGIVKIKFTKGKKETAHIVRSITSLETIAMQNQHIDSQSTDNAQKVQTTSGNNNNTNASVSNHTSRAIVAPSGNNKDDSAMDTSNHNDNTGTPQANN